MPELVLGSIHKLFGGAWIALNSTALKGFSAISFQHSTALS
jgi:hypothetical protein